MVPMAAHAAAPNAPTALSVGSVTPSQVTLSWADNSDTETGFKVERAADAAFTAATPLNAPANATVFTDIGVAGQGRVYYRVMATSSDGNSLPSNAVAVRVPAAAAPNTVTADVVAIDQPLIYNRLGAVTPGGMMFALRRDVVNKTTGLGEAEGGVLAPGQVMLRPEKRPRPLTLRVNAGDQLQIRFQNLLNPVPLVGPPEPPEDGEPEPAAPAILQPGTRDVGIHIMGMEAATHVHDMGTNAGQNEGPLVPPGGAIVYTVHANRENAYLLHNTADMASGLVSSASFGLFGIVNVEPAGSEWYRSQVSQVELQMAATGTTADGHPIIDYDARYPADHLYAGLPILRLLNGSELVHSDLNAIITGPNRGMLPAGTYSLNPAYPDREQPFREFSLAFHDENEILQAFPLFNDPAFEHTLDSVRDSFAINYGSGGIGAEIIANRLGVGPMWDTTEAKYEEFFLSSWVVGDPAIIVDIPANTKDEAGQLIAGPKATKALYPDDPSNVYHSYQNDHVKIRNVHVGKEHHIFHLHTHQWLFTPEDDNSNYLDSQALGPGSSYTYDIVYGGSGNRNKTFGDAIFHCHFYPHFAMGMWGLWRVHDTFEAGTVLDAEGRPAPGARALPDGEIAVGTPVPAVVPLPTAAMAPLPGAVAIVAGSTMDPPLPGGQISITAPDADADGKPDRNVGFPFFIPGVAGHRPPTPPMDLVDDGGLPRHVIIGGTATKTVSPTDFGAVLDTAVALFLPEDGTPAELAAMDYHGQLFHDSFRADGTAATGSAGYETNGLPPAPGAPFADPARTDDGQPIAVNREWRGANIELDMTLNKAGWHFPQSRIIALWGDVADTLGGVKTPEPLVMRANSGDVIEYYHTNLVPGVYRQDAFQVTTPTDVMGQHIHLVKFDVLSADGSANGFNYEDGTFSPDEVRERITAIQAPGGGLPNGLTAQDLEPQAHPFFGATGPNGENWLGARTTIQRWYADPLVNNSGLERPLGNVFTHDHFTPSTVQQAGLYGSLLIEPRGSQWRDPETGALHGGDGVEPRVIGGGNLTDGGPTSWRADIITSEDHGGGPTSNHDKESYREFFLMVADFQLAYEAGRGVDVNGNPIPDPEGAVSPPGLVPGAVPGVFTRPAVATPEAISAGDVGGYSINYRSEPLPYRVRDPATNLQAAGDAGDMALAFSSTIQRADPLFNVQPDIYPDLTEDVRPGDPFTPLLRTYANDRVRVRIQVGATEEAHVFGIQGLKWLQEFASPNSGWRSAQLFGISEQFILDVRPSVDPAQTTGVADYLYNGSSSVDGIWNGAWGLLRTYATPRGDLLPLPLNPIPAGGLAAANAAGFEGVMPKNAPLREYDITAVTAADALPGGTLVYNPRGATLQDPTAILYVRTQDLDAQGKLKPGVPIEPLILRANAGDRIRITLRNRLPASLPDLDGFNIMPPILEGFNANSVKPSSQTGLQPQLLASAITRDYGVNVGVNPASTVPSGATRTYEWYAGDVKLENGSLVATPIEYGSINLMPSDRIKHSSKGGIGALVILPQGATWAEDPETRAAATVTKADGSSFRDFALVFQDDANFRLGNGDPLPFIFGEPDAEDSGNTAVNYRSEPIWHRMGIPPSAAVFHNLVFTGAFSNALAGGDPVTPVFTAAAGTPIRFHLLNAGGHTRNDVFSLYGHPWQREPYTAGSTAIGDNPRSFWVGAQGGMGPGNHFDVVPYYGAGGSQGVIGDYMFIDQVGHHTYNGAWGILRVTRNVPLDGLDGDRPLTLDQTNAAANRVQLTTADDSLTLDIPQGTRMSAAGAPIASLGAGPATSPGPLPDGAVLLRTFQLQPAGAVFSPPLAVSTPLAAGALANGAGAGSVRILRWNGGAWVEMQTTVNTASGTASAPAGNAGIFALVTLPPAEPPPPPAPVPPPGPPVGATDLSRFFGEGGALTQPVEVISAGKTASVVIPQGAKVLTREGTLAGNITVAAMAESQLKAPEGSAILSQVFNMGPDGATFDRPVRLTLTYEEGKLPPGIQEASLVIAYFEGTLWVNLEDSVVDTAANTVTASTTHFTPFAVIVTKPAPAPVPEGVSVPPTEPPPATVATPEPAEVSEPPAQPVPAPATTNLEPVPAVTPTSTPALEPEPSAPPMVNYWMITVVAAAATLLVIGLAAIMLRRRSPGR